MMKILTVAIFCLIASFLVARNTSLGAIMHQKASIAPVLSTNSMSLDASRTENGIRVDWTVHECLSDGFFSLQRIEHTSGEWETLHTQLVEGICLIGSQYHAMDNSPQVGNNMYRVLYTSRGADSILSGTTSLYYTQLAGPLFQLSGNPVLTGKTLSIVFGELPVPQVEIRITSITGTTLWKSDLITALSGSRMEIPFDFSPAGCYYLFLGCGTKKEGTKLVVTD